MPVLTQSPTSPRPPPLCIKAQIVYRQETAQALQCLKYKTWVVVKSLVNHSKSNHVFSNHVFSTSACYDTYVTPSLTMRQKPLPARSSGHDLTTLTPYWLARHPKTSTVYNTSRTHWRRLSWHHTTKHATWAPGIYFQLYTGCQFGVE